MRKFISIFLIISLISICFVGCGSADLASGSAADSATDSATSNATDNSTQDTTFSIVCTIFPEYDWARQIMGDLADNAELTLLIGTGVDLHSFQPTVDDILTISTCDIFIYVGGESDEWAEDALEEATNENMVVINLLEVLGDGAKEEEVVEGMEAEEEEEEDDEDEEEIEYDEHVWLSLKNAQIFCDAIAEALALVDADNSAIYEANNEAYKSELNSLDEEYATACAAADKSTILFGDRFPFRYLVDDYSLSYYAAFVGCSAETEASFETIVFLAQKVDELGLSVVLTIENSDQKIASTIVENTTSQDATILTMDSMQAVTYEDIEAGVTYLSIAEENLAVLKQALQ